MKLLLYCTKAKPYLLCKPMVDKNKPCRLLLNDDEIMFSCLKDDAVNGKIVAECDFEVEEIKKINYDCMLFTNTLDTEKLIDKSCVGYFELVRYLKPNWDKEDDLQNLDTIGYAIHIKNLHIFDKPRELKDYKGDSKGNFFKIIEKAPQNMQMVLNEKLEDCILISIRPEWLCKILNGEKTIEVRKKVLKEMIK